jgi:uncharacterized protein DUF1761
VLDYSVNYLAVIVAAIVAVVIGFIWYAPPVFGTRWMAMIGKTQAELGQPGPSFALAIVAALVNAGVLVVLARSTHAATIGDGIVLGILAWLGFMGTITLAQGLFEKRPLNLWLLNNAHNVIVQALMGAIVAAWH